MGIASNPACLVALALETLDRTAEAHLLSFCLQSSFLTGQIHVSHLIGIVKYRLHLLRDIVRSLFEALRCFVMQVRLMKNSCNARPQPLTP